MAENNKVNSVSFFNSRLTSIISIALVLFLLGLILLMGLLGNQLSVYVRENISFSICLLYTSGRKSGKRTGYKLVIFSL